MEAIAQREAPRKLGGFVQIDDAYLGGEHTGGKHAVSHLMRRFSAMACSAFGVSPTPTIRIRCCKPKDDALRAK